MKAGTGTPEFKSPSRKPFQTLVSQLKSAVHALRYSIEGAMYAYPESSFKNKNNETVLVPLPLRRLINRLVKGPSVFELMVASRLFSLALGRRSAIKIIFRLLPETSAEKLSKVLWRTFSIAKIAAVPREFERFSYSFDEGKRARPTFSGIERGETRTISPSITTRGRDILYAVPHARVVGGSSVVLFGDTVLWGQAKFKANRWSWSGDSLMIGHNNSSAVLDQTLLGSSSRSITGNVLSLVDSGAPHFGHFVLGSIPKLRFLFQETALDNCTILMDANLPANFFEIVRRIAPSCSLELVEMNELVEVESLLLPESLKYFPDAANFGPDNGGRERSLALPEFEFLFRSNEVGLERKGLPQKVLLLRKGTGEADWRTLRNSDQIRQYLMKNGYEDISSEYLNPVNLQILLNNATHIVTEDGSISSHLLLAGIRNKKVIFFGGPAMGDFQQNFLPGFLSFFANDVVVIKGTSENEYDKFAPWDIRFEDVVLLIESLKW